MSFFVFLSPSLSLSVSLLLRWSALQVGEKERDLSMSSNSCCKKGEEFTFVELPKSCPKMNVIDFSIFATDLSFFAS
jgi:hypothetical protein